MADCNVILNWIVLICMCIMALLCFVWWCVGGGWWISSFCYTATFVILSVFLGLAPFQWVGCINSSFSFMTEKYWRPSFIILLSGFYFPHFNDSWYRGNVLGFLAGLSALICLVLGIVLLIIDLMSCCSGSGSSSTSVQQNNQRAMKNTH